MALELIDAVSAPGHPTRPNDDAYCHAGAVAAVFDGATGLGESLLPGGSDAAWLARRAAERLAADHPALRLRQPAAGAGPCAQAGRMGRVAGYRPGRRADL